MYLTIYLEIGYMDIYNNFYIYLDIIELSRYLNIYISS